MKFLWNLALLVIVLLITALKCEEKVTIKTTKGPVKGVRVDYDYGEYYYAFRGIPYAMAPVRELRFHAPVPPTPWSEVFDATDDGNICAQYDIGSSEAIGDEDCLNLNVYIPRLVEEGAKKRSVLVYIHGGAFVMGGAHSTHIGPSRIMDQDVILVTFNYRFGPFGFLNFGEKNSEYSDNNGIRDQILALKWIKDNIEEFGGDASRVTLIGDDAGGVSVSILALSPAANGLFRNAILISGNALCSHYIQSNPKNSAYELGAALDCELDTSKNIKDNIKKFITCMRQQTQQDIVSRSTDMYLFFSFPNWFTPSVDGEILPDQPDTLLREGKFARIPFMIGSTKNEGAFYYRLTINTFSNGEYNDNFIDHKLPRILPIISEFKTRLYPISRHVRKRYFVNVDMEIEDEFRPNYVNFLTDLLYTRCTEQFATHLANHSIPTYKFLFEYRGEHSIVNLQGEQVDMGVSHNDVLQHIFNGVWGSDFSMSKSDLTFSQNVFLPLLINFAKDSIPIPKITEKLDVNWPSMTRASNQILRIGDVLKLEQDYKKDDIAFWNEEIANLFVKKPSIKAKTNTKDEL